MDKLIVIFDRLGPYHWARLEACGQRARVVAVELSADTREYAWDKVDGAASFQRITLLPDGDSRDAPFGELQRRLTAVLERASPRVVAVPGWSDRGGLAALHWCLRTNTPALVMSESQARDQRRVWWKEAFKRRVVGCFSAGLVGGKPHTEYLAALGMPRERIFSGYDVVDNDHFSRGADAARQDADGARARLGLPEHYFLASNRFIEKKNLVRLVQAYAAYRRSAGTKAWDLVLLGDGPLRGSLEALVCALGLQDRVRMPGFKQYHDLPAYYGLAGAFVHASTTEQWGLVVNEAMAAGLPVIVSNCCGCAADLVEEDRNGFTFDPCDAAALGALLQHVAGDTCDRQALGRASREIIARWTPGAFADGLRQAAQAAVEAPKPRGGLFTKLLLWTPRR